MEIRTRVHTIFMLIGSTECGKTTFAKEVLIPALRFDDEMRNVRSNIQYISSDSIRQELLGYEYDKYDQVMLEASEQAFHLLFEKLKMATSFPVNAEFVVLDTTGLSEDFRAKVREIAKEHHYHLDVIVFDYRKREDYYASDRSKKLITNHMNRLRTEVLRTLSREGYTSIHRVRCKDFYSPAERLAHPDYKIVIENKDEYLSTILPNNQKYIVIGDIHECLQELKGLLLGYGYKVEANKIIATEKVEQTKLIVAGDWIDKGKNTRETIDFLYDNQEHFLFVMGNHENFVYRYLQGEIKGVDRDQLHAYFDSTQVLANDPLLFDKFKHLFSLSKPFYRCIRFTGPSYYVTHAPCRNKYIGKLDANAVRHQRNFRIDRTSSVEDQLAFLAQEAVSNHPYHIFGHIAAKQAFRIKNKLHIDTGCVYGNALTSVVISHKPFFTSHKSGQTALSENLGTLFQQQRNVSTDDLGYEDIRRLHYCARNKVNFISGTMSPANKDEASDDLESLRSGLNDFANRGVKQAVLQPKYMGSRCTIYLHREVEHCFAVSRNGYKISQIDLSEVYQKLLHKFGNYMEEHRIALLILDGELLPWNAIGKGLIDKQFKPIEKALETELAYLQQNGFEQAWTRLVEAYQATSFEKDQYHISKNELTEKYGASIYQNYKYIHDLLHMYVPIDDHLKAYATYKKQLELYAQDAALDYKPFALLKIVFADGSERIPDWKTSVMYSFITDDDFLLLDVSLPDAYERAEQFFMNITLEQQMEGIVIKPEHLHGNEIPYMKVRNPEYLSIIYGYDYRFAYKYRKLMKQKNITQKLRTSVREHQLGSQMLAVPYDSISQHNEAYKEIVASLLFEAAKEKEIDPRL